MQNRSSSNVTFIDVSLGRNIDWNAVKASGIPAAYKSDRRCKLH